MKTRMWMEWYERMRREGERKWDEKLAFQFTLDTHKYVYTQV